MSRIEIIIEAIDKEILLKGKNYITLRQANKSLYENGHITESEKQKGYLKKKLEKGEIKNAEQTENPPRQWRIFLSKDGRLKQQKNKTEENSKTRKSKKSSKPKAKKKKKVNTYKNYYRNSQKKSATKKWIIGIAILAFLIVIGSLDDNSNTSEYKIKKETYGATSKENFDEMFRYVTNNDERSINLMILNGQLRPLIKDERVRLVKSHFSYCVIRKQGSGQKFWVVTESIEK